MVLDNVSRTKAFLTHLSISLVIFLVLSFIIHQFWYPDIFFATDGGWQGIRIVLFVDMVLGPLLTLIVFKPGKPGLKWDLTMIGTLQFVCLLIGTYIVYNERPIALVYMDNSFYAVSREAFEMYGKDPSVLETYPGHYPKRAFVKLPENIEERKAKRRAQFSEGSLYVQTELFAPLEQHLSDIARYGLPLKEFIEMYSNRLSSGTVERLKPLSEQPHIKVYPFNTRHEPCYLVFDTQTGKAIMDVIPNQE